MRLVARATVRTCVKIALLLALSLAAGCKNEKAELITKQIGAGSGPRVQMQFGGGTPHEGDIPFVITRTENGADGLRIEAHLASDPGATFAFITPPLATNDDGIGFAKLTFVPTTADAGAKVIAGLAAGLATPAPPPVPGGTLKPTTIPVALLGHGIAMADNGMGGRGTWDATKLFCSGGEIDSAELFFNWSVAEKRGVFSEKDTDYNKDAVACLAMVLRDGMPAKATPATDPTLTATGPRLELGPRIGDRLEPVAFAPNRLIVSEERGDSAALMKVDLATGATTELFTTPERLGVSFCDAKAATCAIEASTPTQGRDMYAEEDPARILVLVGDKATAVPIPGVANPRLVGMSPDGRFVVVQDGGRLVAVDRTSKKSMTIEANGALGAFVDAWSGSTATVRREFSASAGKAPEILLWRLGANGATQPGPSVDGREMVSPDGKRRAILTSFDEIVVKSGSLSRTLDFSKGPGHSISAEMSEWIDNRWIGTRVGFIDTDTMQLSLLPADDDADPPQIYYARGSRTAVVASDRATFLATIVGP